MSAILTKFNHSPVRAMEAMGIFPELKTTALGAVATGNIKAKDAVIAQANIKVKESMPRLLPKEAKTGIRTEAVATLEVSSVMKFTAATRKSKMRKAGTPSRKRNRSASQLANPDD